MFFNINFIILVGIVFDEDVVNIRPSAGRNW